MPASSIDLFHMQDAKNNFIAMRPAPVCSDTNQLMGHCQNVHISKNCYYGFQETKNPENIYNTDCEMKEAPVINETDSSPKNGKKRCAEYFVYPESKRLREGKYINIFSYNFSLICYGQRESDVTMSQR